MPRSRARKRIRPKSRTPGREYGYGVKVTEGIGGELIPLRFTVEQRGVRVSQKWADGSRDRPKEW